MRLIKNTFVFFILLVINFSGVIQSELKETIYIESIVGFELNDDSTRLSYWGQNDFALHDYGFWRMKNNKIDYQNGYFCFDDLRFLEIEKDSVFDPKKYDPYYWRDSILNLLSNSNKKTINFSNDFKSKHILRELNSKKTREQSFSKYTHLPLAKKENLVQEYYLFKVKMKVRRIKKFDFKRCVFKDAILTNFFRYKSIPYFQVISIIDIQPVNSSYIE